MEKNKIIEKLKHIIEEPKKCGFEVYLFAKTEPKLKKLNLSKNNLHTNLKKNIVNIIQEKYFAEDAIYSNAESIADNQNKFYVINQTDEYKPFNVSNWKIEDFKEEHIDSFVGIFFVFRYDSQEIWCYQNKRSVTVTNKKKNNIIARIRSYESGVVFEEQKEQLINFPHTIDILIVDSDVVTDNVGLLERSFDFRTFISQRAIAAANSVAATNLFSGMEKLNGYLMSDARSHKAYRKKMMKALESPILQMTSKDLHEKIYTLPRWKNRFKEPVNGQIPIETNKEIESLIDLLAERFTVSPVSGQEYDTEVKKKTKDIVNEI